MGGGKAMDFCVWFVPNLGMMLTKLTSNATGGPNTPSVHIKLDGNIKSAPHGHLRGGVFLRKFTTTPPPMDF